MTGRMARLISAAWFGLADSDVQNGLEVAALVLQVVVAIYALWLNRVFGTRRAGWALCGAFVLMLAMHLSEAAALPESVSVFGLSPGLTYLFISLLLLIGLSHLAAVYRERERAETEVRKARDELEDRVCERTAELAAEIEQRKRAEVEIRASQQQYCGLVNSLEGIIFECEAADLSFAFVSPQSERLLGYVPDEWLKQLNWRDLVHPEDYETVHEACNKAVQEQSSLALEFRVLAKDQRTRWVRLLANVVADSHGPVSIRGVLLDVTKRRQLEEALRQAQKMEAVGRLSGGVAHDFSNLLTSIQCYAELLLIEPGDPSTRIEYAGEISRAASRGGRLTRQLLTFSRERDIHVEDVDLNKLVEDASGMFRALLGHRVELCNDLTEVPLVRGDVEQLTQVLLNLVVNSRDAMPSGGKLCIKTQRTDCGHADQASDPEMRADTFCCLSISDTGTGISPDALPHIFEPFFTTKETGKGTGLGLAIVYGIVKQHRGWVEVESSLGRGTTFRLSLPAADSSVTRRSSSKLRTETVHPPEPASTQHMREMAA
jgi:PAS domain S-box-containing protein